MITAAAARCQPKRASDRRRCSAGRPEGRSFPRQAALEQVALIDAAHDFLDFGLLHGQVED